MRKITILFLSFVLLFNIHSFAQTNDPILEKLLNAAGDKTYLKDYPFELNPGKTIQFPVHLNKRTVYEWYAFLSEYKQFQITLYDEYASVIFQTKEDAKDIINFSIKSNKSGKYLLLITNTSDEPIKSTILLTYNGKFNPQKANVSNPILDKLLDASNNMYLKDFSMNLESGKEARYSIVLSKNTLYSLSIYQNEPDQFELKLLDNKSEKPLIPKTLNINNKITCQLYNILETGVYHLLIKNKSSKTAKSVVLLALIKKIEYNKYQEEIIPITAKADNKNQSKEDQFFNGEKQTINEDQYFFIVENMPTFNGKNKDEFNNFINQKLKYPQEAIDKKIEGKVFVQFVIDKDGYLKEAKVVKKVHPALDQEALRIVYSSPKWEPGTQRGKAVKVVFTFPIKFKLP